MKTSVKPENRKRPLVNWWAKSWCKNLEMYADLPDRIQPGRECAFSGHVLDILVTNGHAEALVEGEGPRPYKVSIDIDPLSDDMKMSVADRCSRYLGDVGSMASCVPKDIAALFLPEGGLFPSPSEIHFRCNCRDSASMCEHSVAAMYAIGIRFDTDITLLFRLRDIDIDALVDRSIDDRLKRMLDNADCRTDRVLDGDAESKFGVFGQK